MGDIVNIIWILVLLQVFIPLIQQRMQAGRRLMAIRAIETRRNSRVITMIHRQETMSLLGLPIARYIDIEDSEQVLRAVRLTPPEMKIDIILHTPGGLVLAAEQIAWALKRHKGDVTVFVPHYAMSGGTLVAMAADEIAMDDNAVLGPVDPQLGQFPAASVLRVLDQKNINEIDDQTLILADVARKAIAQVDSTVKRIASDRMGPEKAADLAQILTSGRWTHDYPISVEEALQLGLPITTEMPEEVYRLMSLYPQASQRRPSVEYIPIPYLPRPSGRPSG